MELLGLGGGGRGIHSEPVDSFVQDTACEERAFLGPRKMAMCPSPAPA